jgi:hypothetical protein
MHGLISRRKAYATGRINQITTFRRPVRRLASGVVRFFRADFSADWLKPSTTTESRIGSEFVCVSITCNPLIRSDQHRRGRPRVSSHTEYCGAGPSEREFHNSSKRVPALKLLISNITRIRIQQLFLVQKAVRLSAVSKH